MHEINIHFHAFQDRCCMQKRYNLYFKTRMVSGQSYHTFRKSGNVNYPTKLARIICHSGWNPKSYLMTHDQSLAVAYLLL